MEKGVSSISDDEARFKQLQETLDSDPDNPSHHYNLGLFLWERGGEFKDKAVEHFVISAKLNPSNGSTFRFLGHYYSRTSVDLQRASKCYQRAVTLNPNDWEAGEGLCDLLDEGGKETLVVAVCREASEKSPRAFWAFQRLGCMQVYQKKWSEAVQSLQHALRGYTTCADLWEALGLAYQRLGMFTAAIKSYGRAIELEDSRVFSYVESGNILIMLGSFSKGIEQFRHALEIAPDNIAAYYGLASGLLGLSKDCVNSGAFSWGASLLEEASNIAEASACLSGNLSSMWKLLGDIQIAYSKCLPWKSEGCSLEVDEDSFRTSVYSWKRKCLLAAVSAKQFYQRALHLTPWQGNIYTDIAISLDLISSLEEKSVHDLDAWQLPEKMSLGGLVLEGDNNEFWLVLGCLSTHIPLRQHALIRGLQLDASLAVAWAYLGKIYRKEGEKLLARHAFDHARSIDPSLALPWAGMSVDTQARDCTHNEAYESCLWAVQISPVAEFQIGLGMLSISLGHLASPQVFGALQQAVQRAPDYPESHNLNGLVFEAQSNYQSAISAYKLARCAICSFASMVPKILMTDVSVNLARSLCQAGYALDAVHECEDLKMKGLLDSKGLQIYAVALWQVGKNDLALSVARNIFASVATMNGASVAAALQLVCKLLYCISGQDSAASLILKVPKDLLQSPKVSSVLYVVCALDQSKWPPAFFPGSLHDLTSYEEVTGLHSLIAILKLLQDRSKQSLAVNSGVNYLKNVLHMYPDCTLIRNQLGYLLLSTKEWRASHIATRCVVTDPLRSTLVRGSKSAYEIVGSAAVSCYSSCATKLKYSFPTCKDQFMHKKGVLDLQKWWRQEPWNHKAQYFLVLNVLQKAREEKFPPHLCVTLKRMLLTALSNELYLRKERAYHYQKFQLLLCASEVSLQCGDYSVCINYAKDAVALPHPNGNPFFSHLQLCRAYAAHDNLLSLKDELVKCQQIKTDYEIGWIFLKFIESRYKLQSCSNSIDLQFEGLLHEKGGSWSNWMSIFELVRAQSFLLDQDFIHAEQALGHGCSMGNADSCLYLTHGAICMELARQHSGSQFLSLAVSSLTKAQESSSIILPIISALLAQAEASLGARTKWESNLRCEWFSWPAEMRPAESYLQMHLLARQSKGGSDPLYSVELFQNPGRWILRAIHLNPSCMRYWKLLQKVKE